MNGQDRLEKTDEEWRQELTPEEYHLLREKGTEPPFTGKYYHEKASGTYLCAACGAELFSSEAKYDSGSGWPSFYEPIEAHNLDQALDESHGMRRMEIMCRRCGSHLGHVFPDGPNPTGERYCVNSGALKLKPKV